MTSKYEKLAKLAALDSRRFHQSLAAATEAARATIQGLSDYLTAPRGTLVFAEMDDDHQVTQATDQANPFLLLGNDGAWYFAVCIHLGLEGEEFYGGLSLRFFVRTGGERPEVGLNRQAFVLEPADPASGAPLYELVYQTLVGEFSRLESPQKRRIGF